MKIRAIDTKGEEKDTLSQLQAIHQDEEVAALKGEVMDSAKWGAFLSNASDVIRFLIAPLITVGIGLIAVPATQMLSEQGGLANFSFNGLMAAPGVASGMVLFGVGAACTVLAIGTSYVASRIYQSYNFDLTEIGAQHTAKYVAEELDKKQEQHAGQQTCIPEAEAQNRWRQMVALRQAEQEASRTVH